MLDPRRLLTFREVAKRASFSRAAEALALTQPAVSQQVAALEREVGAPLLDRRPGGLSLTETGELLLAHADALSARLTAVDEQLGELRAGRDARLRVGAFPSALATIVPDAIAAHRAAEPDVAFEAGERVAGADRRLHRLEPELVPAHVGVLARRGARVLEAHADVQAPVAHARRHVGRRALAGLEGDVGLGRAVGRDARLRVCLLYTSPSPRD